MFEGNCDAAGFRPLNKRDFKLATTRQNGGLINVSETRVRRQRRPRTMEWPVTLANNTKGRNIDGDTGNN
jgi:hypothetical protein